MVKNRKLIELKNIGTKIAGRLNEVGIFTEDDLRVTGAVAAHRMIKDKFPDEIIPVCYYLYSFEGALCNKHWHAIGAKRKAELNKEIA